MLGQCMKMSAEALAVGGRLCRRRCVGDAPGCQVLCPVEVLPLCCGLCGHAGTGSPLWELHWDISCRAEAVAAPGRRSRHMSIRALVSVSGARPLPGSLPSSPQACRQPPFSSFLPLSHKKAALWPPPQPQESQVGVTMATTAPRDDACCPAVSGLSAAFSTRAC